MEESKINKLLSEIRNNLTSDEIRELRERIGIDSRSIEELNPMGDKQMVDVIADALDELGYPAEEIIRFKKEMKED